MVCPMRVNTHYNYKPVDSSGATLLMEQTESFAPCHEWECPFYDENYNKKGEAIPYCKYYGSVGEEDEE